MISVRLSGSAEVFDGPLDLLLALVRQNRYPLDRLPIAEITRQYSAYVQQAREENFDVELGGEFIEIASWLVLLKSRTLLPQSTDFTDQEPPHEELRRVLLDHATVQQAASLLRERVEQTGLASGAASGRPTQAPQERDQVLTATQREVAPTVHDALLSARHALEKLRARAKAMPPPELYPVETEMHRILAELTSLPPDRACSTAAWFEALSNPEAQIALLLALLELARMRRILLSQCRRFGPICFKTLLR